MRLKFSRPERSTLFVILFFVALLIVGVFTYRDYGETFDYYYHIGYGQAMLRFLRTGDRVFEQILYMKYYGPVVDTLSAVMLWPFMPVSYGKAVEIRHLTNFMLSMAGLAALYLSLRTVYGWRAGLLGMALLVLMPRIYGHSFNNPKDVIFGSLYTLPLWAFLLYLQNRKITRAVLCGFLVGVCIDHRIGGVFLLPLFFLTVVFSSWLEGGFRRERLVGTVKGLAVAFGVFISVTAVTVYVFYPYLWPAPVERMLGVFRRMGAYPTGELGYTLFMGEDIPINELPWYYVPVWVHITTPVLTLFFVYAGAVAGIVRFARKGLSTAEASFVFLALTAVLIPVAAVILKGSTLYDGIRHFLFIFYPMAMLAAFGVVNIFRAIPRAGLRAAAASACVVYYGFVVVKMVSIHPYQALYFNKVAGGIAGAVGKFETDYWGSSYKEGIEWLNENTRGEIRVATGNHFSADHYFRAGIRLDDRRPDFYMSTTRYNDHRRVGGKPVHTVMRDGAGLLYIIPVSASALEKLKSGPPG